MTEPMQDRKEFQRRHGIIGNSVELREAVETIIPVSYTHLTLPTSDLV